MGKGDAAEDKGLLGERGTVQKMHRQMGGPELHQPDFSGFAKATAGASQHCSLEVSPGASVG